MATHTGNDQILSNIITGTTAGWINELLLVVFALKHPHLVPVHYKHKGSDILSSWQHANAQGGQTAMFL